jgi:hypothetical protein
VNVNVASLHAIPVAETVYNVRKQQELTETSLERQFSPAGYQRRHGEKDDVETGEALHPMKKSHRGDHLYNRDREVRVVGVRVAERIVVPEICVQQNTRGGKDPNL